MRTELKTAIFAAMTMLAVLPADAEVTTPMVYDPLMNKIMSRQLTLPAGGVTGSTRLGSGQAIALILVDPLAPLKPVEGLVAKPLKVKPGRKVRRADEQLKKMSEDKRRADWAGRK